MERRSSLHAVVSGLSIALVAAAIGDPLVEFVSNTGVFGSGYRDDNQQSVMTVLVAGLVLASLLGCARLRHALSKDRCSLADWLRRVASGLDDLSGYRTIALVFAAQLVIVDAMEHVEAVLGHGDAIAGLSWLGAPVVVSLAIHLAVCLSCAFAARRVTRALLTAAIVAICGAIDLLLLARARDAARAFVSCADLPGISHPGLLLVRRIRGRAPPCRSALV